MRLVMPEFAAAVDQGGLAVLEEHGLVPAVHGDVVDDVVGDRRCCPSPAR